MMGKFQSSTTNQGVESFPKRYSKYEAVNLKSAIAFRDFVHADWEIAQLSLELLRGWSMLRIILVVQGLRSF